MKLLQIALSAVIILTLSNTASQAEISYVLVDRENIDFNDGGDKVTGVWTDEEKDKVVRYFKMAESASAPLSRMLAMGEKIHGPIRVIKRNSVKWSLGLAKRTKDRKTHYLVLNERFFENYDVESEYTGYEGGNFTFWFFVHELVHLAEFRSTDYRVFLPSLSPGGPIGPNLVTKIEEAKARLRARGLSYEKYFVSTDWKDIDIVRDIGIPTKYSLRAPQELMAEVLTATILAPSYNPPDDIRKIIKYYFRE